MLNPHIAENSLPSTKKRSAQPSCTRGRDEKMRQKDGQQRHIPNNMHQGDRGETMKETQIYKFIRRIILLMGTVVLITITHARDGIHTKEVWRMITITTQCAFLISGIAWMRLNSLTRVKKVYAGNRTRKGRFDMILLGSFTLLQPNDPAQVPTMTVVVIIAMILFLFLACPFLIGKILSKPEWREDEETMEAELPQWDAADNWADLFPRYLSGDVDSPNRSKVSTKK